MIVNYFHQDFLFNKHQVDHQEMAETQEEIQEEMKAQLHRIPTKIYMTSNPVDHMEIQTLVEMTEVKDVGIETRLQ